ncbi:MAG: FapA family protein [Halodesulfovibrio sp.]
MSQLLVHYFDPDFDHMHLTPKESLNGKVDHYNLGYVQNVVAGQVLAELVPADAPLRPGVTSPRPWSGQPLPVGPNTAVNPKNAGQIIATVNGYVFYHEGVITVKKLLNVRRDVDFHTGNIVFVSDICVHGAIRTGFSVQGRNILVKKNVEGAHVEALGSFTAENGIKGGKMARISAKGDIKIPFIENATLIADGDVLVDGSCMHTDVWVQKNLVVKGRLQGGTIHANRIVYVQDQLGGGISTLTSIEMGYDPAQMYNLRAADEGITKLQALIESLEKKCGKHAELKAECEPKLETTRIRLKALHKRRQALWEQMTSESDLRTCRIIVPGQIRPGVEISIGGVYCIINDFMENVCITCQDNEIVFESPAMVKK